MGWFIDYPFDSSFLLINCLIDFEKKGSEKQQPSKAAIFHQKIDTPHNVLL